LTRRDRWAEWLAERRFGGDENVRRSFMEHLERTRDRVLDYAELRAGQTVLDVGCGDGLIGFGALERGADIVFSDISDELLETCRRIARDLGAGERCRFLHAPAEDLAQVESETIDVVATRSVLIYVKDKRRAFEEFHRVLRPGGRMSLFEPINRLNRFGRAWDAAEIQALEDRVKGVFERLQPRDTDPMLDFDERDLVDLTEEVGFREVGLTLEVEVRPPDPLPWDAFLDMAWNPNIPTMREVLQEVLTPEERKRYEAHMRPLVEAGRGSRKMASAYLRATK
jgi:arsenite methyltransferase